MRSKSLSTPSGRHTALSKLRVFFEMIKFEHTIFALPFAYIAMMLASGGWPTPADFIWITVAMVGARTTAMTINRLVDVNIDKDNPRTATRAIPSGVLKISEAVIYMMVSLLIFLVAVYNLAPICRQVWPLFVIPFALYPYAKRFTWLCHIWLGIAIGLAPVAAWLAIRNSLNPGILLLGAAVMFWIAGFDVLYATQDLEHDIGAGLKSIPTRFGIKASLVITKVFHVLAVLLLVGLGAAFGLGFWYFAGIIIVAVLLGYENSLVKVQDLSKLNAAFFTMNGVISMVALLFTSIEILR